ncbi:MAG: ERAP1-like C-terminal domain-containing protein, partial [Microthrixaceae bacterium]
QDEQRHLSAIVATTVPEQFSESLELCLGEVRTQDGPYVLRRALTNPELGDVAWRFVSDNFGAMTDRFPSSALPRMLDGIRGFTDRSLAGEVEGFLGSNPLEVGARQVAQHIERMWASVEAAERIAAE